MTSSLRARPAVFLDRDGVLIRDADYLRDVRGLRLLPGAASTVQRLNDRDIPVVLVTNQSALARGWLTPDGLEQIHAELVKRLAARGARLDGIYVCPHHPTRGTGEFRMRCTCRKPEPGLLLRAAAELGISLPDSVMIGDKRSDLAAGRRAGCATALVLTGQGRASRQELRERGEEGLADAVCTNLGHAVAWWLLRRPGAA